MGGSAWQQEKAAAAHIASAEAKNEQEMGLDYKAQGPPPVAHFLLEATPLTESAIFLNDVTNLLKFYRSGVGDLAHW